MIRKESAQTQDYVSAPPLVSHLDQNMEVGKDVNLEELGVVPSAVSQPSWAIHMCDKMCREKELQVS